jgi:hypothetical protein
MNALDFENNLPTLKKLRQAGDHLFNQLSEGCLDNHGRGKDEGKCMHERSIMHVIRPSSRVLRRSCCLHNCPKLD